MRNLWVIKSYSGRLRYNSRDRLPRSVASPNDAWKDPTLAPRIQTLRERLATIEARPVNNINEYIDKTIDTWSIVDESKGLVRRQMALIANFKRTYSDNKKDVTAADYMMRLTQKDEEILYLLGDEVECARKLKAMPAGERKAYFDENVPQIKTKETQVLQEWLMIAREAKEKGVVLPAHVEQILPGTGGSVNNH